MCLPVHCKSACTREQTFQSFNAHALEYFETKNEVTYCPKTTLGSSQHPVHDNVISNLFYLRTTNKCCKMEKGISILHQKIFILGLARLDSRVMIPLRDIYVIYVS